MHSKADQVHYEFVITGMVRQMDRNGSPQHFYSGGT